ncbi:MAG: leucine-rich repeat domain-containing protein [Verrucomicrobiota bacterium]
MLGAYAFYSCSGLTNLIIPGHVTSLGAYACAGLKVTSITIPASVTSLGDYAFEYCNNLNGIYFAGNAPAAGAGVFASVNNATVYYLSGTTGWGASFAGLPAVMLYSLPAGALLVNITPQGAVSEGAQWQLDGGAWQNPGKAVAGLSLGTHTVSFSTVRDFARPANQMVVVTSNVTATVTGVYVAPEFTCSTNTDGTLSIIGYGGPGGAVTLPTSYNGLMVTSIGNWAFANSTSLTNVTIPSSITSIGSYTFDYCTSLTNVTILNGATSVGASAFYHCTSLISVSLPGSVVSLGDYAFQECYNLRGVYFAGNTPAVGASVFALDYSATLYYWSGTIGWGSSFAGRPAVALIPPGSLQVTINPPDAISVGAQWRVDNKPFQSNGTTVTGLLLGNHTVSFSTINGWTTPTNQVVFLDSNSTATASGTYGALSQAQFTCATNADQTLTITGCSSPDGSLNIPATINGLTVTCIATNAFKSCVNLTSVSIPACLTNIVVSAFQFQACTGLTAITVAAQNSFYCSVNGVLFNRGQTMLVEYPPGLGGDYTIPASVTSIADYAFSGCSGLTNVTFPGGLTNIGKQAFANTAVVNVAIPGSLTAIGSRAFWFCTNLTKVTIPGSVTNIGDSAFQGCFLLNKVVIPKSVTSIKQQAFFYCTNLAGVYFEGNAPVVSYNVFYPDTNATVYYLPGTTGWSNSFASSPALPAVLWNPLIQICSASKSVGSNQVGFDITGTLNIPIVVEVCADLACPIWTPLQPFTLTNGSCHFIGSLPANSLSGYYRIRSP